MVVTGASGNVGTALLRRLTTSEHDLVAVARRPPPPAAPYDRAQWLSAKRDGARVDENWPTGGLATSAHSTHKAAAERVLDMIETEAGAPVLRPRRVAGELARWLRRGRISERRLP